MKIDLGMEFLDHLKIQMGSARQLTMLKKSLLHKLKFSDFYLKIDPVDQAIKDLYSGFTDEPTKINFRVIIPIRSKWWS